MPENKRCSLEISGIGRCNDWYMQRGWMQRHLRKNPYVPGTAAQTAGRRTHSRRENGLSCHGRSWKMCHWHDRNKGSWWEMVCFRYLWLLWFSSIGACYGYKHYHQDSHHYHQDCHQFLSQAQLAKLQEQEEEIARQQNGEERKTQALKASEDMLAKEEGEMRIQKYDASSLILGMGVFWGFSGNPVFMRVRRN